MTKLLEINNLSVTFKIKPCEVRAVDRISLSIQKGEIIGLVGESGSGKSVTALTVMGLLKRSKELLIQGQIVLNGQDLLLMKQQEIEKIRGRKMSMIFQDPVDSLNPVMKIGDQIAEAFILREKIDKREAFEKAVNQLYKVRIRNPKNVALKYPYQLSGGMCQRVMIAIALAARPPLLIADEPTTDLDVTIQAQILQLLKTLYQETGTTIVIITHDLGIACQYCHRIAVMLNGHIVETAFVEELFSKPRHPYTKGLLDSIPVIGQNKKLKPMLNESDEPTNNFNACPFYTRCPFKMNVCRQQQPLLKKVAPDHYSACFRTQG